MSRDVVSSVNSDDPDVHYVVEIRVQRVSTTSTEPRKYATIMVPPTPKASRREVRELAHFTLTENELAVALAKGKRLLELTGDPVDGD